MGGSFANVCIFSSNFDINTVFPHLEGPETKSLKFSFSLISKTQLKLPTLYPHPKRLLLFVIGFDNFKF